MSRDLQDTAKYCLEQIELSIATKNYLKQTYEYLDMMEIENPTMIISCVVMTAAWVYANMGYEFSKGAVPDILGIPENENNPDTVIRITKRYVKMQHHELMDAIIGAFNEN